MSRYHRIADVVSPARWFHGTSAPEFSRFRPGEAYLTDDPTEAMGFAEGGHLGGSSGGEPRALEVYLAAGSVADADEEVSLIVMDEHPELDDIDDLMARLRGDGYRYADFTHPGFAGDDIRVRVSLHPDADLEIRRPAREGKGQDVTSHIAGFHSQEHEDYYMSEACAYFAIALHELHGYPIRILVDEGIEEDGMPIVAHVYAVDRKGDAVDIKGHRSEEEVKGEFWDLVEPATYDVTPEELKRDWMGDDDKPLYAPSESEVAEAKALYAPSESEVAEAKAIILAEPAHDTSWPSPELSRQAWSRDTLNLGTTCSECGSDLDIAGRAGDPDDPLCTACWRRSQMPETPPDPPKGKWWWWNASMPPPRTAAGRKKRPTSGVYRTKVEGVVGGLRDRLLQFSSLLLHRLVEERRFAVMLSEISEGNDIHMTKSPKIEHPDDESSGKDIVRWTARKLDRIKSMHRVRMSKTTGMDKELLVISDAFARAAGWLETAIPIYAAHMEYLDGISKEQDSPERKTEDRDESLLNRNFDPKAPGMDWERRDLFSDRPEAGSWSLRQLTNIYKHGTTVDDLKPLMMHRGNSGAAALLDHRAGDMRSKSTAEWSLALSEDESGEYPTFLDAAHDLLMACKSALTDDEKLLATEWEKIDNIARGGLSKSGAKREPRKPRKGPKKKRWDWSEFSGVKEKDPEERLERQIHRYKRDKRGRFAK